MNSDSQDLQAPSEEELFRFMADVDEDGRMPKHHQSCGKVYKVVASLVHRSIIQPGIRSDKLLLH